MNNDVEVLRADINDVADIARISYQVAKMHDDAVPEFFKPTSEDENLRVVSDILGASDGIVFKAVYDGKICGFLFLEIIENQYAFYPKFGFITNFGVDESYRGRGLGKALLKAAEVYVKEQGLRALDLDVFAFNGMALRFFERFGFDVIDVYMRKILDKSVSVSKESTVKIFGTSEKDIEDISKIYYQVMKMHEEFEQFFFKSCSESEVRKLVEITFKDNKLVRFKAMENEKIIGFLFMTIKRRESKGLTYPNLGYVCNFAVDEKCRKKGVGKKLIKAAEDYVYAKGINVMDLNVNAFNYRALDFYEHHGYNVLYKHMRKVLK